MNREQRLVLISVLIVVALGATRASSRGVAVATQLEPKAVNEQAPWGRNPFLTVEEEARERGAVNEGLKLKATIIGRPRPVAGVSGRPVAVGDKIEEETVVEIRPDAVVLERDGRKRVLRVREPAVSVQMKEVEK